MAFRGWPVEAVEFYEGLAADNSKTYWQDHKAVYERSVKAPMDELLAELAGQFGEGRVFRPYRDVRFSKDKEPYKLNCAAHLPYGYISFSADGLFFGSGLYMPEAAQLQRFRAAIDDDRSGSELEAILTAVRTAGYEVGAREMLKTVPKGFPKDHPASSSSGTRGSSCRSPGPSGAGSAPARRKTGWWPAWRRHGR